MVPLHDGTRDAAFQHQYHLGRNDAPEFEHGQPGRIDLARMIVEKILVKDLRRRPLTIVELGCGAGDISGPYSMSERYNTPRGEIDTMGIEVHGYDIVPIAGVKIAERYPDMKFHLGPVEEVQPYDCDLLIMCEFLEHLADPQAVTSAWMPHAQWAIIGHPLNEPPPNGFEHGHCWSYTEADWDNWFYDNGHQIWEKILFPMGHWERMIIGHGSRR